jgi:hypothetical protein
MGLEFNLAALKTGGSSTISMGRPGSLSQASTPTLGAFYEQQPGTPPTAAGLAVLQTVQEVSTPQGQAQPPLHPQVGSVGGSDLHRDSGVSAGSGAEAAQAGKGSKKLKKLLKMFNKN